MPKEVLTRVVRTNFEAHEYPPTMARLVASSPDEALLEFYTDPTVFTSSHSDMADLALPPWATDAADFIARHRHAQALCDLPYNSLLRLLIKAVHEDSSGCHLLI